MSGSCGIGFPHDMGCSAERAGPPRQSRSLPVVRRPQITPLQEELRQTNRAVAYLLLEEDGTVRECVESRLGVPALGSGGLTVALAPGLSPAPMDAIPVPAHQTGRADFPHPAFGGHHDFALGRPSIR